MKKIIVLAALVTSNTFAFGVLSTDFGLKTFHNVKPVNNVTLGLFVNEPLFRNFEYQSWTGVMEAPSFITKQTIMYNTNKNIKFGLGYRYVNEVYFPNSSTLIGALELKLW